MDKRALILLVLINAAISAYIGFFVYTKLSLQPEVEPTRDELIAEFYKIENAVSVSPHGLRKGMDKGEIPYTIVDLRSNQEYQKEHIIGAINIPAYSDPDTSAYGDVDRIVFEFKKLPKDKEIVVYCYSMPCMTGRKIGAMLVENGIYVKHLGIGWNEWRYYWNLWNHELEWSKTKVEDYIFKGSQPGKPKVIKPDPNVPCSLDNTFGC